MQGIKEGLGKLGSGLGREMNVGEVERWLSMIGGGTLVLAGLSRRSMSGLAVAALGTGLVWRGATGRCPMYARFGISTRSRTEDQIFIERSATIQRSPLDIYHFLREVENLPRFMKHIESAVSLRGGRSHWVWVGPGERRVEWDAQLVDDREGELLRWRSLEGADVEHQAEVRLIPAPGDRGTEVHLGWKLRVPATLAGFIRGKLTSAYTKETLGEELRRLKEVLEAGEIATIEGQTSGRAPLPPERVEVRAQRRRRIEERRPSRPAIAETPTLH